MIEIGIPPNLLLLGGDFVLSWHGFFAAVAILMAVFLVGRWAPLFELDSDDVYTVASFAIIGGIIGARLVHVVDNLGYYSDNPLSIFAIWKGGIGLWGGLLGGFIGGAVYAKWAKLPIGKLADLAAPAVLYTVAIGRIGDIVNGEHCATNSEAWYSFSWTAIMSNAGFCKASGGVNAWVHPVIVLEIFWVMIGLFFVWRLLGKISPSGMIFALTLSWYAIGRFLIQLLRVDKVWIFGLQEAHFISLAILCITIPLILIKGRWNFDRGGRGIFNFDIPVEDSSRAQRRRQ